MRQRRRNGRSRCTQAERERLESLEQFANGIVHDFNNVLAVIHNYASLVVQDLDAAAAAGGDDRWTAIRRDVEQIQRAAERATLLTDRLLAFGRHGGEQPVDPERPEPW